MEWIKNKLHNFMKTRFGWGLIAVFPTVFTDLIDILVKFFTLGYYSTGLTFSWMAKITVFHLKLKK